MLGAVYMPLEEILPPVTDQVTAVLLVPVTAAVNCCVPPANIETDTGDIETETGAVGVAWLLNNVQPDRDKTSAVRIAIEQNLEYEAGAE